jgi:hypothetical protein
MREAIERSIINNQLRQKRLERSMQGGDPFFRLGSAIRGRFEQPRIEQERVQLESQLAGIQEQERALEEQRRSSLASAIERTGIDPRNLTTDQLGQLNLAIEKRKLAEPKERRIIQDVGGFQRFADTGERVFPEAQKEVKEKQRRILEDPRGVSRFVDTGEPVFPDIKPVDKKSEELKLEAQRDLPLIEDKATQSITLIDKLVGHEGLESAVGAKGVAQAFGIFDEPVAGTAAADFTSLFDQIKGKQFLEAFQSLKGGGQITEVEGKKATQAISRMNLAQSEKEFKQAAREFQDVISLGLKRAREKAGIKTERTTQLSTLPQGAVSIGTSGGKPVFQTPDGRTFIQE